MCQTLDVSTSAYYDWIAWPPSQHEVEDGRQTEKIQDIHEKHKGNYGARSSRNTGHIISRQNWKAMADIYLALFIRNLRNILSAGGLNMAF